MKAKKMQLKGIFPIVILGFFLVCVGCETINVSSDYDQDAKLSDLTAYAWVPGWQPKVNDPRLDSSLFDTRIRTAIEKTLAGKGYQKTDESGADFWVSYQAAIDNKLDVTTIDFPYATPSASDLRSGRIGGYSHWSGYGYGHGSETFVTQYEQGTLMIDIVDPKTKNLMWRGTAKAAIDEKAKPEKREARINSAVEKVFANFPPQN